MKHDYDQNGWVLIPKVFDKKDLDIMSECGYNMRLEWEKHSLWHGISCAGRFSEPLTEIYTSGIMRELATEILGTPHLFNDQVVYKLPNDGLSFAPHYDNQYSIKNKSNGIHTVNFSIAIEDITLENGAFYIYGKDEEWHTVLPKAGDVMAINGSTIHKSYDNKSDHARGIYACVYTEQPMCMEGFYSEPFNSQQKNIKLFKENA